jgi:hypothetical protein
MSCHLLQTCIANLYNVFEHHIPKSYRPKGKYLIYLYTNVLLGHLSFLLNKRDPKTLAEAYNMAIQIEKNLSSSRTNDRTMDTLSLIKLVSLETFAKDPQERRQQVFDQQNEDMIKEKKPKQDDEVPTRAPPSDEVIREPVSPAQQSEDEVSCFPLQDFDDTLFLDSKNEGEMKSLNEMDIPCCTIEDKEAIHEDETITHAENAKVLEASAQEETVSCLPPLVFDDALLYDEGNEEEENEFSNVSNPACYDTDSDTVDNIDEFIHVGRCSWCCRLIHTWETWKKSSIHSVCPWGQVRVKVLSPNPQLLRLGQLLAKPRGVVPNKYTMA